MNNFTKKFKTELLTIKRHQESARLLNKYPTRIPVIIDSVNNKFPTDNHKFLVPNDCTMSQFMAILRTKTRLKPSEAIYVFTESGTLVTGSSLMSEIYRKHKNKDDNFLYLEFDIENTFG